jgi:hypothetical protein
MTFLRHQPFDELNELLSVSVDSPQSSSIFAVDGDILVSTVFRWYGVTFLSRQSKYYVAELGAANRRVSRRILAPQFHSRAMVR